MLKFKAIALDIDGTLVNHKQEITPATKKALIEYQKAGGRLIIATGRPYPGAERFAKVLEFEKFGGILLSFNGGRVMNVETGDMIQEITYGPEIVSRAEEVSAEFPGTSVMTYKGHDLITNNDQDQYVQLESVNSQLGIIKVNKLKDYVDFPVNKCIITGEGSYLEKILPQVAEKMGDKVSCYRSDPYFLEVVPKGIDKAAALGKILEYLGIEREELAAFGDGFNDISMIRFAGAGFAMDNAQACVKEVADFLVPSNESDGIAYGLKKYIM